MCVVDSGYTGTTAHMWRSKDNFFGNYTLLLPYFLKQCLIISATALLANSLICAFHLTIGMLELGLQMCHCIWLFNMSSEDLTQVTRVLQQVPLLSKPSHLPSPV